MSKRIKLILLLATIAAAGSAAYASQGNKENDAATLAHAKIPLIQAVSVAEQHASGKASRAEFENSKQGWVYDIEVVSGAKVFDVRVDAGKGTIISSQEDTADHDDSGDQQD
jgi:uncharacterized membrane protein YkoI